MSEALILSVNQKALILSVNQRALILSVNQKLFSENKREAQNASSEEKVRGESRVSRYCLFIICLFLLALP